MGTTPMGTGTLLPRPRNDHDEDENSPSEPYLPVPLVTITTTAPFMTTPFGTYCGASSSLGCLGMLTQDIATLIDLVGVGVIEAPGVMSGCIEGGPLGCVIAEVGVIVTWNLTLNNLETAASSASLALTVVDDALNNGGLGENSATSFATWVAGLPPLLPSWDLVVDGYSSGYNHGLFNGIHTVFNNGLFRK